MNNLIQIQDSNEKLMTENFKVDIKYRKNQGKLLSLIEFQLSIQI